MQDKIKRLLFTAKPFFDESFIGYIMRLAELNEIREMRWILKLVGKNGQYDYRYKFNSDFKIETKRLSQLSGANDNNLRNLLYLHQQGRTRNIIGNLIIFGEPILHHFIKRENPKICPQCLIEQNYCRKIWELSLITVCPNHSVLLIDTCPNCQRKIAWTRPAINLCHCEFDFQNALSIIVSEKELQLTQFLYQSFGLSSRTKQEFFTYPLNTLKSNDLLKVIYFVMALLAEFPDFSGITITRNKTNVEIHQLLQRALEIFDNWETSYPQLIKYWKTKEKKYFVNCKVVYLSGIELPRIHSEYELFNQMLNYLFYEEQFKFMHQHFQEFLKQLPPENLSQQFTLNSFLI